MSANAFKASVLNRSGGPAVGSWLMSASGTVAEALGHCGFDFLVVDMEHSPLHIASTLELLRALAATPAVPLVRIAQCDQMLVKQVLDAGAASVMFPFVQTAEQARAAVAYTRYPPQGVRGVAAMHRGSRYGSAQNYLKSANDGIAVVVQLETPEAIERLADIAAVPGVDSLFVGPGDLAAAMGHLGDIAHAQVQSMIARAAEVARTLGKPIGIVGGTPQMVRRFFEYGYTWSAIASDLALLTGRATEWLESLGRDARGANTKPSY
ncbi:MAG: HpcH/HpaI aldolase family protein [Steroidobacteraceae bacterium]